MSEFEQFYVNPQQPTAIAEALREQGIVTFTGITDRAALTAFAGQFMTPRDHRDADADHITGIRPDDDLVQRSAGTGFSRAAVPPHTEGSSLPRPPRLLLLACVKPASVGGTTVVVDGAVIYHYLRTSAPKTLAVLSESDLVTFGSTAFPAAPFQHIARDRIAVRYRDDALADVAPAALAAWRQLRKAVLDHQIRFKLKKGQGLIINNTRWLHGRDAFEGGRLVNRIVGDPRAGVRLPSGFDPVELRSTSDKGR